ncbi:DUF7144 family membrane protein [Phytomonospora endophytica]|uniref:DUF7144 domain-containing protein n=1 Tax=Phytomonospora endophytica TaxID=714109 RepID=A0A841FFC4_9ACTN|nr:hypothetical protein [Phytomonospora endophytica]MBB6034285.1 hypothetical protein [Phytomonospora endophytica]GIG66678.1 hypothetical protein Pen01_29730 [Phytomonospora endophytica]
MSGENTARGWSIGGMALGASLMLMIGAWQALAGIAAIAEDDVFVQVEDYVFRFDLTTWGWIHLIVGVLVIATAAFVLIGQSWARWVAIGLAVVSATAQFLWLPYQPAWSMVIIAIDVFVIWSLIQVESDSLDTRGTRGTAWSEVDPQATTAGHTNPRHAGATTAAPERTESEA